MSPTETDCAAFWLNVKLFVNTEEMVILVKTTKLRLYVHPIPWVLLSYWLYTYHRHRQEMDSQTGTWLPHQSKKRSWSTGWARYWHRSSLVRVDYLLLYQTPQDHLELHFFFNFHQVFLGLNNFWNHACSESWLLNCHTIWQCCEYSGHLLVATVIF